ncbi:uncharacterized protein BKCO1_3400020 [Diplodia corticola]|uniref:Uncharacterized protein n=1 Tax=Diplodia corticola TaxID=236234 RepID=A0A1J9S013_9PEZI|nr:uncharacterized protein BKCO1_3400020 [Diplodia corticola]OJD33029.1 hypothetical protein BKCO1_3400020 [Diplodia corticola]
MEAQRPLPEPPKMFSDIPDLRFNQSVPADDIWLASEKQATSPDTVDVHTDQATPSDEEKQPRDITWRDLGRTFVGPQVLLLNLEFFRLVFPEDFLTHTHFPQPWVFNHFLVINALLWLCLAIFMSIFKATRPDTSVIYWVTLLLLWHHFVTGVVQLSVLPGWLSEVAGWILFVTGGQLLMVAVDVWRGEYAWPQASHELRRRKLEFAHVRDPEKGGYEFEEKGGEWITMEEVTDEFIAEVFKRPSSGFRAVCYFFGTVVPVMAGAIWYLILYILCFVSGVCGDPWWMSPTVCALCLGSVVLIWLDMARQTYYGLRELPCDSSECSLGGCQEWILLGGANSLDMRRRKVVYKGKERVEYR